MVVAMVVLLMHHMEEKVVVGEAVMLAHKAAF
jgi:hypothetical protein